eukprot:Skav227085  [mRNA]  locus=scaffold1387:247687:247866:- [translate_table: standard]
MASQEGHIEVVRLLLQGGSDSHQARSTDGWSPLQIASHKGHVEVVRLLGIAPPKRQRRC